MARFFKSNELLRIWINKTPDTFMPMLNQLRLIQLREKNPKAKITLVTAINDPKTGTPFLTSDAQTALKDFCKRLNITVLDVQEVEKTELTKTEKKLFEKICQETAKARDGTGGNLAAASDMLRAMPAILKQGIYSDFDTKIDTSELPDIVQVKTDRPILFTAQRYTAEDQDGSQKLGTETNIDILIPTFSESTCASLDEKFLLHCKRVQMIIVKRYENLAKVFQDNDLFNVALKDAETKQQLLPLLETQDLFGLRRWVSEKLTYEVWLKLKKQEVAEMAIQKLTPNLMKLCGVSKTTMETLLLACEQYPELSYKFSKSVGCYPDFIKFFNGTHQAEDIVACNLHGLETIKARVLDQYEQVDLSQYQRTLSMSTEQFLQYQYQTDCKSLLKQSVSAITGPSPWQALFMDDFEQGLSLEDLNRLDRSAIAAQQVTNRSGKQIPLSLALSSMQSPDIHYDLGITYQLKESLEDCLGQDGGADFSWLPSGEAKLQDQNKQMDKAAQTIQHAYRAYKVKKQAQPTVEKPCDSLSTLRLEP